MSKKTIKDFAWPKFILDVFVDVAVVIVLVLIFRAYLYAPFQIHGPSMCDTFNVYGDECHSGDGEYVLTSRLSVWDIFGWSPAEIQRGDVVIFQAPYGEKGEYFIKRVIGLPGDTVEIEDGLVYVNGEELVEEYLNEDNAGNTDPYRSDSEAYEVDEGAYFVLGDNRTKSSDSRRCFQQLGCTGDSSPYLDFDFIEGEVKVVIYPLSHFRFVGGVSY